MAAESHIPSLIPGFAVGVVGAGVMGAGIAQVALLAGHTVRIYDARSGAAGEAVGRILAAIDSLAQRQKITTDQTQSAAQRLRAADSLNPLADCGLIIEAISEDLEAKRALFRAVEAIAPPQALLATNTSSLSVTAIAAALQQPQRLAGMHFFNPAPVMPLVEIVRGAATSPAVTQALEDIALGWGKTPVLARSTPGFIVNRVARPFYAEALRVLQEGGADCATIDAVMREAGGFRMGPFELMDLIGNDVNYAVTCSVFSGFYGDPRFAPSNLQLELVQAGYWGRKAGRGFYAYEAGKPVAMPTTAAACLAPSCIYIYGDSSAAQALAARLNKSGATFEHAAARSDDRIAGWDGGVLYRTDGRTATARAAATGWNNTILLDLAFDDRTAARAAIAAADQADRCALSAATGLLQSAGYSVSVIADLPGLIVLRTLAMLVNIAADAVNEDVCSVADLDLAMRKGMNYPCGLLEWADAFGLNTLVAALHHLAETYGEARYRVSPLLRRKALTGSGFTRHSAASATTARNRGYQTVRG